MFVNIVKKIYLVNKSSVGIIGRDMRYEYIDNYIDHKKSFPCLSFMYRYLRPPWTAAPPESKELLALCLKKIKGMILIED